MTDCKLETEEVEAPVSAEPAPVPCVVAATAVAAPLLEAAIKAEPRVEVEVLPEAAHEFGAPLPGQHEPAEPGDHRGGDPAPGGRSPVPRGSGRRAAGAHQKPERTPLVAPAPVPVPVQRPGVIVVKHS